ncbi:MULTISPECIES: transcriptional regulator GcvA [unclassified Variovorax]|jgi:LysR family glycine cleavage system transcriptional activator|uniref:transcriptional regulator GcvA n=2 Tax=Bacteria TaxID=2 RepID=UPI000F7E5EF6|nr:MULTISPECIES: transcriptional regulator GcvA [unclassified Variovorax]RSZ33222.1 transcriptional regulator GcvA [Variovorax sp. 553]RSZ33594.1 transcriptional regulator GcvA [Variovorax sp. 679]
MEHQLPPLNALRAFEAAARHLSVKNAADELCVTPGAVSQLVKTLELHLGVQLFRRVNRGIFLTDAGQAYLPPVRNAFRQISDATQKVAVPPQTGLLTVSATPFFASAWLVPRLKSFQDAHPDIDLQVLTSNALADFSRDGVDVAIRHGMGQYPGLASQRVLTVEMVPVAAPALVAGHGKPKQPADLLRWPRVNDADRKGWRLWFEAQGIDDAGPARGPSFGDTSLLLQAVLAGQGAALLPAAMMASEIAQGRLVQLSNVTWLEDFAYYLVCPEASRDWPKVVAFRDWLLDAVREKGASSGSRKRASPTVAGQPIAPPRRQRAATSPS